MGDDRRHQEAGAQSEDTPLAVRCPCCESELELDRRTGAILSSRRRQAAKKDFDALLRDVENSRERAERRFDQERAAVADRDRLLDERFRKALEAAESDDDADSRPVRPFDLD